MNGIPDQVRPHLRCPRCRGELEDRPDALCCEPCALVYPVRRGRPILIAEEARPDADPPRR